MRAEGFYKTTEGLSRFMVDRRTRKLVVTQGESRAYGLDLFAQKRIKQHDFWVSYTLSRVEEAFPNPKGTFFKRASQDQTHELKGAAILNFKPWVISANYVYGSGLYQSSYLSQQEIIPYSRLDVAFMYQFALKFKLETGLSVVNLLNHQNVGYNGYSSLPQGDKIYAKGMPFTPSIFLNIGF